MTQISVTGKTVEEATQRALAQLGVPRERVTIRVTVEPSRGLFGVFGARDAQIEATVIKDPLQDAVTYLQEIIREMGVDGHVSVRSDRETHVLEVHGENLGILIGRHGQTLDALQYLVNLAANRDSDSFLRIIVDAEGYRERRRETLLRHAVRMADRAVAQGRSLKMEPMNSQERKLVHVTLQDRCDVSTLSEGDEPFRHVVIIPRR